jgi:hypothetical protein
MNQAVYPVRPWMPRRAGLSTWTPTTGALARAMPGYLDWPEHVAILEHLREQVDKGRLMLPLSVHYMEVGENPETGSARKWPMS